MQVKDKTRIQRRNYISLAILKGAVSAICLYYIYSEICSNEINFSGIDWPQNAIIPLTIIFFLMPLNWYLEVLKWKVSISPFEKISIVESWKSVLAGVALNWVMPFTSGDFAARIMTRKDKYQSTSAILLNRTIMLLLTLLLGGYSLFFLRFDAFTFNWVATGLSVMGLALLFYLKNKAQPFLQYFRELERGVFSRVVALSILRYLLFTYQFFLLIKLFNQELDPFIIVAGIGWIFLMRSVIPHFLGGIGLRESAGIVFFSAYIQDITFVVIPITLIWLINTVVPSLFGVFFLWKYSPNRIREDD